MYQLSWMADSRRLRFCQWRTAVLPKGRYTASPHALCSGPLDLPPGVRRSRPREGRQGYRVHLRRMPPRGRFVCLDVGGPQKMCVLPTRGCRGELARLRNENSNETHKRCKTEEVEVLSDLQDMEIPLEDMGDVIVLTGL